MDSPRNSTDTGADLLTAAAPASCDPPDPLPGPRPPVYPGVGTAGTNPRARFPQSRTGRVSPLCGAAASAARRRDQVRRCRPPATLLPTAADAGDRGAVVLGRRVRRRTGTAVFLRPTAAAAATSPIPAYTPASRRASRLWTGPAGSGTGERAVEER